ncbi:MAG: helix-turn-helix domain-containing protein [Planctomycetota bacterium]
MTATIDVVADAERAVVLFDRTRLELLRALDEPRSAAALGRALDLPRQRVNYHLRELERERLVECVAERARGSVVERVYRRSGQRYVVSGAALGALSARPDAVADRFSSDYQMALASRAVEELGALQAGAAAAGQALPTLSLSVEVAFATPGERSAFAEELADSVATLVQKYHAGNDAGARTYRLYLGAYPKPRG